MLIGIALTVNFATIKSKQMRGGVSLMTIFV